MADSGGSAVWLGQVLVLSKENFRSSRRFQLSHDASAVFIAVKVKKVLVVVFVSTKELSTVKSARDFFMVFNNSRIAEMRFT